MHKNQSNKFRLANALAVEISDMAVERGMLDIYTAQLVYDSLVDGLMRRTEQELQYAIEHKSFGGIDHA